MGIAIVRYRSSCHPFLKLYQGRGSAFAIIDSLSIVSNLGQKVFETLFLSGIQFHQFHNIKSFICLLYMPCQSVSVSLIR